MFAILAIIPTMVNIGHQFNEGGGVRSAIRGIALGKDAGTPGEIKGCQGTTRETALTEKC
jgi:hypothetical protein